MMQSGSVLYEQYADQSFHGPEPISPLRASVDPRFSSLLIRAAGNRERLSQQQQVSQTNWMQSSSTSTINTNAWSPKATTEKSATTDCETKKCLTPVWKNRLQGLLVGLAVAAIMTAIALAIGLTRTSATSATSTTTTAPACGSLRWNPIGMTVAGNGTPGSALNQLYYPYSVYVDANNAIYVADYSNQRIQQWLPNAVSGSTVAGVTGICLSGGQELCSPRAIYGDSQQNLYIADSNGIYFWPLGSSNGTLINSSSTATIGYTYGVFVDKSGNLYASINYNYSIVMWTPTFSGTIVAGGNGWGYSSSQLNYPYGLSVDSVTNTIYIANTNTHTIVAWQSGASTGTIIAGRNTTFGGGVSSLRNPRDVKRDSNGNLYVADTGNNCVLLFCQNPPSTTAITIAGTGLNSPGSIALDSDLNVYVADYNNHRIQKFSRIV